MKKHFLSNSPKFAKLVLNKTLKTQQKLMSHVAPTTFNKCLLRNLGADINKLITQTNKLEISKKTESANKHLKKCCKKH